MFWVDCGIMYQEAKQADKAIQYFQKAISLNPRHALAYYNMGVVYRYNMKDLGKSNMAWKKYLEIDSVSPQAIQVQKPYKGLVNKLIDINIYYN